MRRPIIGATVEGSDDHVGHARTSIPNGTTLMQPKPPKPPVQSMNTLWIRSILLAVLVLLLTGCDRPLVLDQTLPRQIEEIGCISRCQATKDSCDADARFDYRQCQAGFSRRFRDYRWCLASSRENCGYPWWNCSENRYGYCTNRYWECRQGCLRNPR